MIKTFKKLWGILTFPLSTSKEKMKKEYKDLDIVVLWLLCCLTTVSISSFLNQNMVSPSSLLYSTMELLTIFACLGIIHMSLELIGNYRRAKLRKTRNK